ncbi:MAG TPA: TonB-dependent receptor [Pyrinomonadaceae bacterium]|nr:TonB-dependent receptor [Pyrinomonadaceae bacterium]
MRRLPQSFHRSFFILLFAIIWLIPVGDVRAQDYVTGAFLGQIVDSKGNGIPGVTVQVVNNETGVPAARQTGPDGKYRMGQLQPADYTITISKQGFVTKTMQRALTTLRTTDVIPPVQLDESVAIVNPVPTDAPVPVTGNPPVTQPETKGPQKVATAVEEKRDIRSEMNTTDARRDGTYSEKEVSTLPLGGTTLTRTFDELGLLLPGVALPPQTQGSVAGPGVGAGVGSAGQFAVNGLRSRANNFTVDGSDNNDEDIGVRRQGFFALVPQPMESIKEFQMITLLAPAQYGRNIGAQVNAVSKSGGNQYHGTIFGFLNTSQLNAAETFDTTSGNTTIPLRARTPTGQMRDVYINDQLAFVNNRAGKKDSLTLGQGGLVLGGPLVPSDPSRPNHALFFFVSMEGQRLNASKEANFAVPTIAQRGAFGSGATGVTTNPLTGTSISDFPTTVSGDAIFSFFPFPNNPNGAYGENTFTQALPSSAQSKILSGKVNGSFSTFGKPQEFVARYNFTDDWRDIPVVGGALFSRLRSRVGTQNFSTFLNTQLSNTVLNQFRASYGRTRLRFGEGRDQEFLLPVRRPFNNFEDARFLMNTRFIANNTLPGNCFTPEVFVPCVNYDSFGTGETETQRLGAVGGNLGSLGPVGQISISGFSSVGVDVFNFPQSRVNNTYQLADTATIQFGGHTLAFGTDSRRTELISDLPRNARPLVTFNGAPRVVCANPACSSLAFAANTGAPNPYIRPEDFAAAGAPSGFFQSLVLPGKDSHINLRYYQLNFFGQDEWRLRPNLSLSFGLRYEYNTPPREAQRRIESTFNAPLPTEVAGLRNFIGNRTQIFQPDRNNFGPRVSVAYSPRNERTVIRAGYGLFYDQILGAVVSQSRNVFPTFTTVNLGGGCCNVLGTTPRADEGFNTYNPLQTSIGVPIVQPGTLNTLNPQLLQSTLLTEIFRFFPAGGSGRPFGATLPTQTLKMPVAHQYSVAVEQQLGRSMVVSAAYIGTKGQHLLRFATPNLGPNYLIVPLAFTSQGSFFGGPTFSGITLDPGSLTSSATLTGGRPVNTIGPISQFETTARSRYDALQVQLRGRMKFLGTTQYQVSYTFSKSTDDASDVFDLAGSSSLPQNSLAPSGEYAPSNFDARHRFAYSYVTDAPHFKNRTVQAILGNLQIAGTGQFQTGQPFTVNSIFDVNLDGNLTDRLDRTDGIVVTGDRGQPLRLTANPITLLAAVGKDGKIPRNSFRASNLWVSNAAVIKTIGFSEQFKLVFRTEVFNVFNRANYGIPVRFLEAPGFGKATDTVTPGRRIQFALKLVF